MTVSLRCILLPGLDGTADLFAPFLDAAPKTLQLDPRALPNDVPRGYAELSDGLVARLPDEPVILVAESFSGPLALLVADRSPQVRAVVLCATFVESPVPAVLGRTPAAIWKVPPPLGVLGFFLTGGDRAIAARVREAMAGVPPAVIAARVAALSRVDVRAELDRFDRPLLCLAATRDRLVRTSLARRIAAHRTSSRCVEIDGPHLLLQTRPAACWAHIAPFVDAIA